MIPGEIRLKIVGYAHLSWCRDHPVSKDIYLSTIKYKLYRYIVQRTINNEVFVESIGSGRPPTNFLFKDYNFNVTDWDEVGWIRFNWESRPG